MKEDVIHQLRTHSPQLRSDIDRLRLRLRAGLPGSIVLAIAVACLAPMYWGSWPYMAAYVVVQAITIIRVLIAVQMYLAIRHVNPEGSVAEVARYVEQLEMLQQFNRRYTLYVKLPLTACIVPLVGPPLGWDFFAHDYFLAIWLGASALLIAINAVVAATAFRRLEKQLTTIGEFYKLKNC